MKKKIKHPVLLAIGIVACLIIGKNAISSYREEQAIAEQERIEAELEAQEEAERAAEEQRKKEEEEARIAAEEKAAAEEAERLAALPYGVEINMELTADEAFEAGNDNYMDDNYPFAEGYYRFALDNENELAEYHRNDVRNNLVLALLQGEKNEEALELCRELVKDEDVPEPVDVNKWGYIVNLLVCAHANDITAADELSSVLGDEWVSELVDLAGEEPAKYAKLLTAMIYNAAYMDIENDKPVEDGAKIYEDWDSDIAEQMVQAITKYDSDGYTEVLMEVLVALNEKNVETFGEEDPDITELLMYLTARLIEE